MRHLPLNIVHYYRCEYYFGKTFHFQMKFHRPMSESGCHLDEHQVSVVERHLYYFTVQNVAPDYWKYIFELTVYTLFDVLRNWHVAVSIFSHTYFNEWKVQLTSSVITTIHCVWNYSTHSFSLADTDIWLFVASVQNASDPRTKRTGNFRTWRELIT